MISFCTATLHDLPEVLRLLEASGLPIAGVEGHIQEFILALEGERVVGCAGLEVHGVAGLLRSVVVDESYRSHGLGEKLTWGILGLAQHKNLTSLSLLTDTAQDYFPRFGFARVERAELPEVREATEADLAAIAEIYNQGIRARTATFETDERTAQDVRGWLNNPKHPLLVAEKGGQVWGWIHASSYRARDCYAGIAEFSVYVAETSRGQGVGDALMAAFIPACERAG